MGRLARVLTGFLALVACAFALFAAPQSATTAPYVPPPPTAPSITSISPDSMNQTTVTVTLIGSSFDATTTVQGSGVMLTPTLIDANHMSAVIPAGQWPAGTTVQIIATNSVGPSNAIAFFVLANGTVTSANTASAPAAGGPAVLSVFTTDQNGGFSLGAPGSILATAFNGTGAVTVALYSGNPVPLFGANGADFDINLSPGSTFPSVQVVECLDGANGPPIQWYNGTTWLIVSDQQPNAPNTGCTTLTFSTTTTPSISQLTGTVFAAGRATPQHVKSAITAYVTGFSDQEKRKHDNDGAVIRRLSERVDAIVRARTTDEKMEQRRAFDREARTFVGRELTAAQANSLSQIVNTL